MGNAFSGRGSSDRDGDVAAVTQTKAFYRRFADIEVGDRSPVYRAYVHALADDPDLVARLTTWSPPKRQPNLVLAAARFCGAPMSGDAREFVSWLKGHWVEVEMVVRNRRTQTNEVGRMATLLPVLGLIDGPISLIEVGASAGLCLYPDRYSYRFQRGDEVVALDPADGPSGVILNCVVDEDVPVPTDLPTVTYRAGVDLSPLDVRSADDMRWLETLVWPGQDERVERLRAATVLVQRDPPRLVTGDLIDAVAELVRGAPRESTVVVFHSAVLAYVAEKRRALFAQLVRELPCRWLANEGRTILPDRAGCGTNVPGRAEFTMWLDGVAVAVVDPHGAWVEWGVRDSTEKSE